MKITKNNHESNILDCEINNKVYFDVPELGVKFLIDKNIKDDLIYKYYTGTASNSLGYVSFSTKSLIELDSACSSKVSVAPLGILLKNKGKFNALSHSDGLNMNKADYKQFDDYYIIYNSPQAPCSENSLVNKYALDLLDKIKIKSEREHSCIIELK